MGHAKAVKSLAGPGFSIRLREERVRLNLTQAALAQRAGIAVATQVAYEQGVRTPDVGYLQAVVGEGVDLPYLQCGVRANRFASQYLDWDMYATIREGVRAWCSCNQVEVPTRELVEIERLLYDLFVADQQVESQALERVLRLVANR